MSNVVMNVLKKIGAVLAWPFKHSEMLAHLLDRVVRDTEEAGKVAPEVKALIVGLIKEFEALGPDTVAVIAEHGVNFPDDLKEVADIKGLFAYFKNNFLPGVEKIFTEVKMADAGTLALADSTDPAPAAAPSLVVTAPAAASAAAAEPQAGPGLHNVVPA